MVYSEIFYIFYVISDIYILYNVVSIQLYLHSCNFLHCINFFKL
jgi:hypothetical protein